MTPEVAEQIVAALRGCGPRPFVFVAHNDDLRRIAAIARIVAPLAIRAGVDDVRIRRSAVVGPNELVVGGQKWDALGERDAASIVNRLRPDQGGTSPGPTRDRDPQP